MISTKKLIYNVIQRFSKVNYKGAIEGSAWTSKSIASGSSWVNLGSITVPPGVWLVSVVATFPSNSTGYRMVTFSDSSSSGGANLRTQRMPASNGTNTNIPMTFVVSGTEAKTYYLNVVQNSGSALSVDGRYSLVKLADSLGTSES